MLCGLGGSAGFHPLFSAGQDRVTVAVSAVVLGIMPAMVALGERIFMGHRPNGTIDTRRSRSEHRRGLNTGEV